MQYESPLFHYLLVYLRVIYVRPHEPFTSLPPPPPFSIYRYFLPSPFPDCLYFSSLISHDSSREHYEYHAARYLPIPPLLKAHHVSIPAPSRAMESSWCSRTADLHAVNPFCVSFRASTISDAGLRAGSLAVVNMVPLFAGADLACFADQLGISLRAARVVHRSAGFMAFSLGLLHVLVINVPIPLNEPRNLFVL